MSEIPDDIFIEAQKVRRELVSSREFPEFIIARAILAERQRCAAIAADILKQDAWRDHWEDDYAGGANVRAKLKNLAALNPPPRSDAPQHPQSTDHKPAQ